MLLEPLRLLVWLAGRALLMLRYRVTVTGLDAVRGTGPYLILPNHPAYMDPPNVLARVWRRFRPRPMLLETNFQNPLLAPVAWLTNAIKVPDLSKASVEGRARAEAAVGTAIDALRAGDNVILWSSGRLSRDGSEKLGGARSVADLVAAVPGVTLVLVRTRGLWGSSFSWADGERPDLMARLFRGGLIHLANLVFFTPKRRVTVTVEAFGPEARPAPTREAINPWLEAWYNADTPAETPTFVPYHFLLGPRTHDYPPPPDPAAGVEAGDIPDAVKAAVARIVADKTGRDLGPADRVSGRTFQELGIDSLDGMEIGLAVEREFGFSAREVPTTVGGLWALAAGRAKSAAVQPAPPAWGTPPSRPLAIDFLGETVPEAILRRVLLNPHDIAVADDTAGTLTYQRFLLAATLLADRFAKIEGQSVGLMLPASVAGVTSLLGLHLAGKLPVILNWTTGPNAMGHAVKVTGLKTVVTSKQFIDRTQIAVPGAAFYFLEDVRGTVGTAEKLRRLLAVTLFRGATVRRRLARLPARPDDPAVVLFTSGSEKAPKAVPLSHRNVIENMRGAAPLFEIDRQNSGLVFLPLFHSFGHTVTGLLPLFIGLKVVYHPDPTDAGALAGKCAAYKTTILAATPTFLSYLFEKAKPGELESLRVIVLGAERCPDALFDKAKRLAPNAVILEGYGITECSPVVSLNPRTAPKRGTIGKALTNVELAVRDLETDERLPAGKRGMLHVRGPNVFAGYLGGDTPPPFREIDGERWYVTGDLAELDADGYVVFHGRLKRFLKAGGEMISLPALEEPFAKKYPPTDAGPRVAVEGVETDGGRKVVLFTTEGLDVRQANDLLQAEGFRGVMRLDAVERLAVIPTLGTGKIDYKVLKAKLTAG
jgi:long-chain-fatty-acid--[acyl-carrier-protein] ligase